MFHTFSYDSQKHAMMVSQKVWSDFGQQIPLIRSFSLGNNFPRVQFPLFSGEPIRYHFLFYLFVGILERMGLRIDWALNLPSIAGFFLLLTAIFLLAKKLFKDERVAVLSVIFFLFNGSLSFIYFFQKHPLSFQNFSAFAPWDKTDISAFWNLNIFTNQRHLALAFGIALLFLYTLLHIEPRSFKKQLPYALGFGVLFGIFPFFHQPTLLIVAVCEACYFLLFPKLRPSLLVSGLVTLTLVIPQIFFLSQGAKQFAWYPGYLARDPLTIAHVVRFWWMNLGLHSIFIPLGFLLAPKKIRKFFVPMFVIFILANLFKFSPEVAANHKFFNFFLILGNMLTAYALIRLWSFLSSIIFIKFINFIIVIFLVGFLTLSGLIDFFVVFNDTKGALSDIPANKTAAWIAKNTPKDAVFLNSSFLYHPASLAGRTIFLGWPYFAWSAGYDTNTRLTVMRQMYATEGPAKLCKLLKANHISYVSFQDRNAAQELVFREVTFQKNFREVFSDTDEGYRIYDVSTACPAPML